MRHTHASGSAGRRPSSSSSSARWSRSCGSSLLSLKTPATATDGASSRRRGRCRTTPTSSSQGIFTSALRNSIGIGLISTALAVVIACAAAYAIARLHFPGKRLILAVSLAVVMFPQVSLVGPLYNLWRQIGLYDTWPGLIIPYLTFALPLSIFTLSSFFREIPWELEQAAQIDGATPFQAFRKVIAPLATPGIVDHLHHRLHHLLERLHLRDLADLDHRPRRRCRRRSPSSRAPRSSPSRSVTSPRRRSS